MDRNSVWKNSPRYLFLPEHLRADVTVTSMSLQQGALEQHEVAPRPPAPRITKSKLSLLVTGQANKLER